MRTLPLILLAHGAVVVEKELKLNAVDCDLCSCVDRRWPNCTSSCERIDGKKAAKTSIANLENILLEIGATCQVYADISYASELENEDWCLSTTPDVDGFVVSTPPPALDGYNFVRADVVEHQVKVSGSGFSCGNEYTDGYMAYPTEFSPSKHYCPIQNPPDGLYSQRNLTLVDNVLTLSLEPRMSTQASANITKLIHTVGGYRQVNDRQPFTLRYVANDRSDGYKCYGDISKIVLLMRTTGYVSGRNYNAFRATARKSDMANLTRIYHQPVTDSAKPPFKLSLDDPDLKGDAFFDFVPWE